jgi:hypothetical protein
METLQRKSTTVKRSDWCKALSYYSEDSKICSGCQLSKSLLTDFVLPIEKASKKLDSVDLQLFSKSLAQVQKPSIIKKQKSKRPASYLIYLDSKASFSQLFESLALHQQEKKPAAIIISPTYFSKSKRIIETRLVREIQQYFDPTGFIKLPIEEVRELLKYAKSQSAEMMILPYSKLAEYLQLVKSTELEDVMAASFYPVISSKVSS